MGLQPIPLIPPRRQLTRLERAEKTIAAAKESFAAGDLTLEEFEVVVDCEYRDALGLPKTMEQLEEEMRARVAREEGIVVNGETRSERVASLCKAGFPIACYPGRPEFDGLSFAEIERFESDRTFR